MASGKRQRTVESSLSYASLPIHFERGFNLDKLFEFQPIVSLFRTAGIESMMVRKPNLANTTLVRDFYATWDRSGEDSATVLLRGIPITITPKLIQKILGLPRPPRGCPNFFQVSTELGIASERYTEMVTYLFMTVPRGGTLHSGFLKKEFILLNLFLKFDLYPSSSYSVITTRDLVLLYWIATGQRFDVADVIFRMLAGTATSAKEYLSQQYRQKVQLVYPFLITRICESMGVPVYPTDSLVAGRAPLTSDTVKKSIAARGKQSDASTSSHAPAPAPPTRLTPPPPPSDAPTEWTPQMFSDRLYALETAFHSFHTQYRSDQTRLTDQMDQLQQYQQYIASALHEMRPGSAAPPFYQPPPPPPPQQDPPPPPPRRQPATRVEEGEEIGSSDTETDTAGDEDVDATGSDDDGDDDDGDDDDADDDQSDEE